MNLENDLIIELLKKTGKDIYLVGGVVRDMVLKKENHDKDIIVCDSPAKEFSEKFAKDNNGVLVELDAVNNIYRVVLSDKINYVDITNPINNSFEEDIKRRDLTINSLALSIYDNKIIDLTGGLEDLKRGVIRFVSEKNLVDDPLRILRAFRFSSVLGFEICEESVELIEKHKDKIYLPAVERRNVEIVKLFGGKYAHNVLLQMDKIGLVEKLFPDMKFVKKVPPNTHHHLDLFHHSLETVRQIQLIYENSNEFVKSHLESIDFGGDSRLAHLKFAGFLHDIGKFSTWTIEGERHRFIKHDEVGSEMSKKTLRVSKFSKKQIDYISFIIRNHIYPSSVISSPNLSEKVYMRYVRKAGDNAVDLIVVAMADRLSARGKAITDEMVAQNISGLEKLLQFYIDVKPTLRELPKLLSGDEIMDIKKIKPSAELGRIIKQLHEAQLDGDILTKQQAIDFVMKI